MTTDDERDSRDEPRADRPEAGPAEAEQPDPDASSDGDGSWTDDPQTQDPDEDRSVEEVVRRTAGA